MVEMREAVAVALYNADCDRAVLAGKRLPPSWERVSKFSRTRWRSNADVAIRAMMQFTFENAVDFGTADIDEE